MLRIRPARLDDPDALAMTEEVQRWYVEIYGGRDDDPADPDEFAAPAGGFLIGDHDGEPVAMGGWSFLPGTRETVKIRRMYVRPAVRRLGYAATLLDRLESDAAAAGATRVALTTGTPQEAAIRFYRSRGYADIAPFGFHADGERSVHLGKPLRPAGTGGSRRPTGAG